jgi:hypothetical protein
MNIPKEAYVSIYITPMDPTFDFVFDANPGPDSQNDADPDPQHWCESVVEAGLGTVCNGILFVVMAQV